MSLSEWIDIVVCLSAAFSLVTFISLFNNRKSLLFLYFGSSALFLLSPYFISLFIDAGRFFEWGRFLSVTASISALLVLIRDSKPVFGRFPAYMTALPFISILFFPFIVESLAVKDLLNAIYQGGVLVVGVLVFSVNHFLARYRLYFIIGLIAFIISYLSYWLIFRDLIDNYSWLSEIFLSAGIIFIAFGFKKVNQ